MTMNRIIAVLLIGILLTTSLVVVKSAYASSSDNNLKENASKDKQINQSHGLDYIKHKVTKQKAYGYGHSKVCGLELCTNAKNDTPSYSFKSLHGDGKIYLKGYKQYTSTNSTK
jgi:hypothetical protein